MKDRFKFNTIPEALKDIQLGKMIVVVDDEDRENEGDLVMASAKVTPQAVNFMAREGFVYKEKWKSLRNRFFRIVCLSRR
ncbi:MAG: 3,4-dihydroxy-2-butanone-4-phosphate synthase [Chitinophagaceae bacterium]|nr:3,4-dihydroxy-2-butanone-4-phosphate synthase [Chitinophagaceae bacterium]